MHLHSNNCELANLSSTLARSAQKARFDMSSTSKLAIAAPGGPLPAGEWAWRGCRCTWECGAQQHAR